MTFHADFITRYAIFGPTPAEIMYMHYRHCGFSIQKETCTRIKFFGNLNSWQLLHICSYARLHWLFPTVSGMNAIYYRPQRSCGKVMFLHLSVILFTRGVSNRHLPGQTPPWADTGLPLLADTGLPLLADTPPQGDDHCSGRYASYWNAFLLIMCTHLATHTTLLLSLECLHCICPLIFVMSSWYSQPFSERHKH